MVRVLRLTLAGGGFWLATGIAFTGWLERLLCGSREWSLRPRTPLPTFSEGYGQGAIERQIEIAAGAYVGIG